MIVSDEAVKVSQRFMNERRTRTTESHYHQKLGYHLASSLYVSIRMRDHPVMAVPTKGTNFSTTMLAQYQTSQWLAFFDPRDMRRQNGLIQQYISSTLVDHQASVDYIIFRIQVSKKSAHGLKAATHLVQRGYRLELLSASHSHPLKGSLEYGPNTQLRRVYDVQSYFLYGRRMAIKTRQVYQAYLFATKKLDMAIPSAQQHINLQGFETADVVLNVDGDAIPYRECPNSIARIGWRNFNVTNHNNNSGSSSGGHGSSAAAVLGTKCLFDTVPEPLWFSGTTLETSDLICLDCTARSDAPAGLKRMEATSCLTRYLPDNTNNEELNRSNSTRRPNVLFLLLEQVSHERFKKIMPLTRNVLTQGGFLSFDRYTATSFGTYDDPTTLFWTEARSRRLESDLAAASVPYHVFSGASGCNATVAIHTNRTLKWNEMMCRQTPSRPNCIGSTLSAAHLVDYARKFLTHHSQHDQPWAAFLTVVEGQEDTGILPGMIDGKLSQFLEEIRHVMPRDQWDRTMIVVTSDRGATRGSFAQTVDGQKEMIRPLLYLKMPPVEGSATVQDNRDRHVIEDDLMATLQVVVSGKDDAIGPGHSLTSRLPDDRNICELLGKNMSSKCEPLNTTESKKLLEKRLSVELQPPPSVLSFYADSPQTDRKHLDIIMREGIPKRADVTEGCLCASNIARWYPCSKHPWASSSPTGYQEMFMLVDCPGKGTHLEIRLKKNHMLMARMNNERPRGTVKMQPNVIFLEVDSVSGSYADRHFPKTREFLQKYRVRPSGHGQYQCYDGLCSADFTNRVTLAGASSIPNQVASLSGCLSSDFDHLCGLNVTILAENQYCNDPREPHFGLQIQRIRFAARHVYWCPPQPNVMQRITPWVFGVTNSLGYANYFGEEFCYEGSPYVTQGNVFPDFYADITPHSVFCRLAEQRIRRNDAKVPDEHRWGYEQHDQMCVDSNSSDCVFEKARISLDMIEQMWDLYTSRPKFAFLNVLAAHVYNVDWSSVFLAAERYDAHLSTFLERMTNREDFQNTMIIVRSDHGLQKGPMAMDYSLQVEHTRPWTQILVPESFPGLSKKAFFKNQNRMVSGHDLYHTIRSAIDQPKESTTLPPLGNWSFDLVSTMVPENRTCRDARADPDLCREQSIHPSFGICNRLDKKQSKFCRSYEVKPRVDPKDLPMPPLNKDVVAVPANKTAMTATSKLSQELSNARDILKKLMNPMIDPAKSPPIKPLPSQVLSHETRLTSKLVGPTSKAIRYGRFKRQIIPNSKE